MSKIEIFRGSIKLEEIELEHGTLTIGRASDNDIQLDDPAVSNRHAKLITLFKITFIEDLESTNGTLVNGKNVYKQTLRPANIISLGKHQIVFHSEEVSETQENSSDHTVLLGTDDMEGMFERFSNNVKPYTPRPTKKPQVVASQTRPVTKQNTNLAAQLALVESTENEDQLMYHEEQPSLEIERQDSFDSSPSKAKLPKPDSSETLQASENLEHNSAESSIEKHFKSHLNTAALVRNNEFGSENKQSQSAYDFSYNPSLHEHNIDTAESYNEELYAEDDSLISMYEKPVDNESTDLLNNKQIEKLDTDFHDFENHRSDNNIPQEQKQTAEHFEYDGGYDKHDNTSDKSNNENLVAQFESSDPLVAKNNEQIFATISQGTNNVGVDVEAQTNNIPTENTDDNSASRSPSVLNEADLANYYQQLSKSKNQTDSVSDNTMLKNIIINNQSLERGDSKSGIAFMIFGLFVIAGLATASYMLY